MAESITLLLGRWKSGDHAAGEALLAQLYPALREIAQAHARRHGGPLTLRPTELAHEAFLRLYAQRSVDWQNRDHFLAVAATVARRVLVDHLRTRGTGKRGGGASVLPLHELQEAMLPLPDSDADWLALDQALQGLESKHPEAARVVELKFFGGLEADQIARVMDTSTATVGRQWRFARAWLGEQLGAQAH